MTNQEHMADALSYLPYDAMYSRVQSTKLNLHAYVVLKEHLDQLAYFLGLGAFVRFCQRIASPEIFLFGLILSHPFS